jgi:tetratricopeptide (TPR) repeat protein
MKQIRSVFLPYIVCGSLLALLLYPGVSPAATTCEPWVAKMVSVQGNVEARRAGQAQWQPAQLNDTYCAGDRIQVGDKSRADVALVNQPVLRLDQNSTITFGGVKEERTSLIDLVRGAAHFFSRLPRNLEINTAFVNAGVEGTEALVRVEADRTFILVFEGKVVAANPAGSLTLTDGQAAIAEKGKAPVSTIVVRPRDAVQWALYYPPVAYFRLQDFEGPEPWRAMVRKSIEAYMRGDYGAAFEAIKSVPPDLRELRFLAYRAQLLLGVGRIDEASKDIERALSLTPDYSEALALQSIIAVVQNEKEKALNAAKKAVAADPKSATALIAQSYARQADFDLEGARSSLQQAVQVSPSDALAWARLAELHMAFAELDKALEAAEKAVSIAPNLSRTHMVLGFAHLLRVDTTEAKKTFERAIQLDQADSLSRLGLGLAKIRESDFEEGRRDIEIAGSLDPNNAIIRSYLGKAYFEEKRADIANREYATAKELDPLDPTAFFYDAIKKQTENRPIEALRNIQKAIELNDNRAVYRSRLQLDADLAARSASLARIYSDLGFQQLALVEGWKSVNTDPTNFSAHRFLADSYSILPRHEIARVSELLQSQLLQPLNMTPIQPRLAESNLFLVSAGGPGALSFNEFNPLFNRDGVAFQATSLAGENRTYTGEGVFSGIFKKASFSLGYSHFQTNGWRKNAFQDDDIGNVFLQLELSPQTSIQGEYRFREIIRGDLRQLFFPEIFFPNEKTRTTTNTYRLGFRHAFSPGSVTLGNFQYRNVDDKLTDFDPDFFDFSLRSKIDLDGYGAELQHLFRSHYISLAGGAGHFKVNGRMIDTVAFGGFPDPPLSFNRGREHANLYLYSYVHLPKNVTLTLGASGDLYDPKQTNAESKKQFNPKLGVTWNPFAGTTVRGAAFRTLKRTLVTNQTLEPTQVAGFNQLFDDADATEAWRYGVALDQKFSPNIYGGLEWSKRDTEVPFTSFATGQEDRSNWKDYLTRVYLFWTPHPWLAFSTEYHYERFKRSRKFTFNVREIQTHKVPLGINFFHPSGLSASLKPTYYNQDGKFGEGFFGLPFTPGRDDFWVVDAAISYRLPRRYGFITVGATNLFDKRFKYFNTDLGSESINPRIIPDRVFFFRLTLALP